MRSDTRRPGPFYCAVPRCADTAEGAIELLYADPLRRYLCGVHLAKFRELLAVLLHEPALAPPAVVPGQTAAFGDD